MAEPIDIEGYDVQHVLGHGGSAAVYAATARISLEDDGDDGDDNGDVGRRVAIKVFATSLHDAAAVRRFEREVASLQRLAGVPGVVRILDTTVTGDGRPCLVMERMDDTVAARLRREGPLSVGAVTAIGVSIARALDGAHRRGVVHRDVKPANVLIGSDGSVALADFDIAVLADSSASTITLASMTPPHAAPERLLGAVDDEVASDVWSLASTLFTALNGRPPFGEVDDIGGVAALVDRVLTQPVPRLARADVPPALVAVLHRGLAKSPADRFPSAAAFALALEQVDSPTAIAGGVDVAVVHQGQRDRARRSDGVGRSRRSRLMSTVMIAAVAVLTAGAAGWLALR